MKVVVTGGAGFIGSRLVQRLEKEGHEVICVDLKDGENFIKADIRDYEKINEAMQGVDIVCHLAAQISVPDSVKNPVEDFEINVFGTLNVLRAALENKVKKVVFMSSAAVYGDPKEFPIKEDSELKPISPYGLSKLTAECCCRNFSKLTGLETVIFRTFNVYGKGSIGVISKFIENIKAGKNLVVYGDGEQIRDFLNVEEVVDACLLAINKKVATTATLNLADGKETTINKLIEILKKVTGKEIKIKYEDERDGDIKRSWTSISKIKDVLGFEPRYTIEEGLEQTWKEYEE